MSTSLIVNADISASANIADTKLATISTAGKVSNSATTATSNNVANAIVARDASGNVTLSLLYAENAQITAAIIGSAVFNINNIYLRPKTSFFTQETSLNASTVLTVAQLLGGLVISTAGGNITLTYPSASALVVANPGIAVGDTYQCLFQTTAGGNISFTAGAGIIFRRNTTVNSPGSALHFIRFANVSTGTEAVVVYQQT